LVTFVVQVASTSAIRPITGTPRLARIAEISYCPVTMLITAPVISINSPAGITPAMEDFTTSVRLFANRQ